MNHRRFRVHFTTGFIGVMNRTHTQMAARLLRSTILQPVIGALCNSTRTRVLTGVRYSEGYPREQAQCCGRSAIRHSMDYRPVLIVSIIPYSTELVENDALRRTLKTALATIDKVSYQPHRE